jgi:hypothetical protein
MSLRIDALLVSRETLASLCSSQKFELRDADAVLAGNDTVQPARDRHDARHRVALAARSIS